MKRATDAMKAAEDKVAAIGDRMEEEERRLQVGNTIQYKSVFSISQSDT